MSRGARWVITRQIVLGSLVGAAAACWCNLKTTAAEPKAAPVNFQNVAPLFTKYCVGCHNDTDREGKLSLQSYDSLRRGGQKGSVITPGQPESSRLIRVLTGQAEPKMPPKGEAAPTQEEIQRIADWIAAGAPGPAGQAADLPLVTPAIPVKVPPKLAVHALAIDPAGKHLAVARHGRVELVALSDFSLTKHWEIGAGSVQGLEFSRDGQWLVVAAGEPALFGEVQLIAMVEKSPLRTLRGHRDSLYAARLSPDGRWLATAGYDQLILMWDVTLGQVVRTLEGHNGAVFDLAFRPDGRVLASASGDRTVKLWDPTSGQRRDTLKEPLKEVYTLAFSPDGRRLAAAGADNRIRLWQISPTAEEGSNPLLASQFAHETPVLRLAWSPDGQTLVSAGEDRLVKVWDAQTLTLRQTLPPQSDWVSALAITPDSRRLIVGRVDGSLASYPLPAAASAAAELPPPLPEVPPEVDYGPQPSLEDVPRLAEAEPNDQPAQAGVLPLPGRASGRISRDSHAFRDAHAGAKSSAETRGQIHRVGPSDRDLYRFEARAGEQWVFEIRAAQAGSPLDSHLAILDAAGSPVPRLLLRAVRDSVIEFRGMSSEQRGVRLANWEEMLLNDYVYLSGDVIKLFQQRRGPDADALFYPESGNRMAFFDTTSRAHALGEPAYVVVPYPIGTSLPDNGLPVFTLYYENDDDAQRELGKDSRLTFVAPADGVYLVQVRDVRGFQGPDFTYELVARRPQRDFEVSFAPANLTISPGSGRQFTVKAKRRDQYFGPITVELTGLPAGFSATTPVVIQAGLYEASGAIYARDDAQTPSAQDLAQVQIVARAVVYGQPRQKMVAALGKLALAGQPKVQVWLTPLSEEGHAPAATSSAEGSAGPGDAASLPVLRIRPGGTTAAQLRVVRHGFTERIALEVLGLPHGVIVDDIGLNGVLIPPGQTERKIFLKAEPWVPPQSRLCFAVAQVDGNQASPPVRIEVVSP